MIKVGKLKEPEISAYCELINKVVAGTTYYSKEARKSESIKYPKEWARDALNDKKRLLLCAKDKDKVVGFLFGRVSTGMLDLMWLGVGPKFRGQGIAEKLIRKAESWSRGKVHKIWFDTRVNNKESIALVKKLKYKKVATLRKHFYGQDFYFWEKLVD